LSATLYESRWKRILTSQAYMIGYSVLLALLGKARYALLLVIVFWIILAVAQSRLGKGPLGQGRAKAEDILSGRKLYEEKNVREIQMKDEELLREIQEQSRISLYLSVSMLIGLLYFLIAWKQVPAIANAVAPYTGGGKLALFIAYLIYFEGYFIIYQASFEYALRKVGTVTTINTPQSYVVTDKGILMKGLIGSSVIRFPLPSDINVHVNEKRGFVELVRRSSKSIVKIRFYARNARRLGEIIKKKGLQASGEG